jgi:hypothetical protein
MDVESVRRVIVWNSGGVVGRSLSVGLNPSEKDGRASMQGSQWGKGSERSREGRLTTTSTAAAAS